MRSGTGGLIAAFILILGACTPLPNRLGDGTPSIATAKAALASGAPDLALRICTQLFESGQRTADVLICKGNAQTALSRNSEAAGSFASALQMSPTSPNALIGVGRLRLTSDPAGAEQMFMQALAQNPRDSVALNNLGIARDLQGRHQDAQFAYGEAIAADPDARAPLVNLALSMALSGRSTEALRILRPLADRPDASVRERHDYAAALAMAGKPEEAGRYLQPELTPAQADDALSGYRAAAAPR